MNTTSQPPVPFSRHQCMIYQGAGELQLPKIAAIIERKMNDGFRCLYLHNLEMVTALTSALTSIGVDVSEEVSKGRLMFTSETPGSGDFDVGEMLKGLETALDQSLAEGFSGLFATGDMTWELGNEKNFTQLMEYEHRLEKFFRSRHEMHGICQYHVDTLPLEAIKLAPLSHQTFFVNETLSRNNPFFSEERRSEEGFISDELLDAVISELVLVNGK